ncbi:nuclear transport factor 2 family protein [Microbulbifer pacificus]|uniref:Nuclear transport factor 2 family protein n=1 Tax=Microbulbifer pacificus TaxID=407164 RepID=A0AAU0N0Q3_9GAMM|nr:nuclear transport factor 2 family protein [Microbulbifer pacificus]WOX05833.1 nuclear transport factor 2 family protein [Microbulbifer pacificus]
MVPLLQRLEHLYADFLAADPRMIGDVYAQSVIFRDPVHELRGLPAVLGYFSGMAENLRECRFEFDQSLIDGDRISLWWTMHYRHPKLAGGKPLTLRGASLLEIDPGADRVTVHEDIYDLGAMVYEQIPVLGSVVKIVKSKLAQGNHQKSHAGAAHVGEPG